MSVNVNINVYVNVDVNIHLLMLPNILKYPEYGGNDMEVKRSLLCGRCYNSDGCKWKMEPFEMTKFQSTVVRVGAPGEIPAAKIVVGTSMYKKMFMAHRIDCIEGQKDWTLDEKQRAIEDLRARARNWDIGRVSYP